MDANTVIQAISNVGFPIAAFMLMCIILIPLSRRTLRL